MYMLLVNMKKDVLDCISINKLKTPCEVNLGQAFA
jgi:hypothetical protein